MPTAFYDKEPDFFPASKIVTYAGPRGGTGKTCICSNIATLQAISGAALTLMIDLDPQYALTDAFGLTPDTFDGMDVCKMFEPDIDPLTLCYSVDSVADKTNKLYIIPGSQRLALEEEKMLMDPVRLMYFRQNIKALTKAFYQIHIDVGPMLGSFLKAALFSSTEVVIPVKPEHLCFNTIDLALSEIEKVMDPEGDNVNRMLEFAGVIINRYNPDSMEQCSIKAELESKYKVLGVIKDSPLIVKGYSDYKPVVAAHPASEHTKAFKLIASQL